MQVQLAMAAKDAVPASSPGAKPATGKPGPDDAFAGLLMASGSLVAQARPAETATGVSGNDEEGTAETPAASQAETAGDTKAIPAGLVPWKSTALMPGAVQSEQVVPEEPSAPNGQPASASPLATEDDTRKAASISTAQVVGAEEGFAGAGATTVPANQSAAPSSESAAVQVPSPTGEIPDTKIVPAAETVAESVVPAGDGTAVGPEAPAAETLAESVVPAGDGTVVEQEAPAAKTAPGGGRPLEVADVLALKARQLRQQGTRAEAGKPTYENPRLTGDRTVAAKAVATGGRERAKAVVPTGPKVATQGTVEKEPAPVRLAGDVPELKAEVEEARISAGKTAVQPVKEAMKETPARPVAVAAAGKESETKTVETDGRQHEDPARAASVETKTDPQAASQTSAPADAQAATGNGEQAAAAPKAAGQAGPPTTITTDHAPAGHDQAVARAATPVFRQVVENLDLHHTGSKVRIQLNPEHLGRIEVSLTARDSVLEVRIVADNPLAAQSLDGNLHELTDGLKAKAGHFQHLDVQVEARDSVRVKPDDGQSDRRDQQRGQEKQGDGRQDGSRDRGRRQNRSGTGRQDRTWAWTGTKEEA